jgi:hypothetical protein
MKETKCMELNPSRETHSYPARQEIFLQLVAILSKRIEPFPQLVALKPWPDWTSLSGLHVFSFPFCYYETGVYIGDMLVNVCPE